MMEGLRPWAILSLVGFLSFLGATYDWFDADEFVNIQQADRSAHGHRLYVETPSNHPPLYTELLLRPLVELPGSPLLAARVLNAVLMWATGLMVADLFRRDVGVGAARTFLTLWTLNGFVLVAGTRAMNEAPLVALLTLAAYALRTSGTFAVPAAAAAASLLVRYSALFYIPALVPRDAKAAARLAAWGLLSLLVLLAPTIILRPEALHGLVRWTLEFHAERGPEGWDRRIGKTLWWSGVLFAAPLAYLTGHLRKPLSPSAAVLAIGMFGALTLVLLPAVHVHYFLPCAIIVTVTAVVALGRLPSPRHQQLVFTGFLMVTASQGGFYILQTPHAGIDEANQAADWIETNAPSEWPILTDAPQYAILAHRDNWNGYYWALRGAVPDSDVESALNETSLVAVSERFGHYDRGFPAGFLVRLDSLPCKQLDGVRLYWTGTTGAPSSDFAESC